jgi:HD-GYP domain-containing protein (c-di-GMP phosphodiesterase class II)
MTSHRPYRRALAAAAARDEIARCSGTQFDPRCAEAFLSMTQAELDELVRGRPADLTGSW